MNAVHWRRAGACLIAATLIAVGWGGVDSRSARAQGGTAPAQNGGGSGSEKEEPAVELESAAALPNETYFALRPDLRRCAFPRCGGFFVQRVNREQTRCADGNWRDECYVAELELGALGLTPEQEQELRERAREFLLRGALTRIRIGGERFGSFGAQEAWRGHEGVRPRGAFFRARDLGIVCVTFPCPSFSVRRLNLDRSAFSAAGVDLSGVSPDPSDGIAQLAQPEGLLVAARTRRVSGPGGRASELVASEYYLPFPLQPAPQSCGGFRPDGPLECPAGQFCSYAPEDICGAADAPGVCADIPLSCEPGGDPVCGCDGHGYANACEAARAGTSPTGGVGAPTCDLPVRVCDLGSQTCGAGEFCDFGEPGQCSASGATGLCHPTRDPAAILCSAEVDPVCGCDGQTYSNGCQAYAASVSVAHAGECTPAP